MKQLTILSGKAMIVELPEGAAKTTVGSTGRKIDGRYVDDSLAVYVPDPDYTKVIDLPPGNWQIVGMLSEVREEQVAGMAEAVKEHGCGKAVGYKDHSSVLELYVDTATESIDSSIYAEGYTFENKFPQCTCKLFTKEFEDCPHVNKQLTSCEVFDKHESAQSRVLCRERCLLLRRVDI